MVEDCGPVIAIAVHCESVSLSWEDLKAWEFKNKYRNKETSGKSDVVCEKIRQ
jgi:hypothetical protein